MITLYKDERVKELSEEPQRNTKRTVEKLLAAGWQVMKNPAVLEVAPTPPPRPEAPVFAPDGPLVSVVMPAWRAGEFIGRSIRSMRAQTLADWELCICADGSEDDTYDRAVAAAGGDSRILIERIPHGGYAAATNCCLCMSTGRIIARLDADDQQHPERLERQATYLAEHPVDIVTCDMMDIRRQADAFSHGQGHITATGTMDASRYVAGWGGPCHPAVVAWRWVYDVVGGFDPDEEWDGDGGWNLRAIRAKMRWGHIDEAWYYHRRYPEMRSEASAHKQNAAHENLLAKHRAMAEGRD